jgi:hypothetical protein
MKTEIYNKVEELTKGIQSAETLKRQLLNELGSYYWRISLCNSSDSFYEFKKENPDHPLLEYCHVQRPLNSGWKSDVIIMILRCDISKEDFLAFARLIVSPTVGDDDFNHFEYNLSRDAI